MIVYRMHARMTVQLRCVAGAAPVHFVVDLLFLHVQIAVLRFQQYFAFLTVNEFESANISTVAVWAAAAAAMQPSIGCGWADRLLFVNNQIYSANVKVEKRREEIEEVD